MQSVAKDELLAKEVIERPLLVQQMIDIKPLINMVEKNRQGHEDSDTDIEVPASVNKKYDKQENLKSHTTTAEIDANINNAPNIKKKNKKKEAANKSPSLSKSSNSTEAEEVSEKPSVVEIKISKVSVGVATVPIIHAYPYDGQCIYNFKTFYFNMLT